MKKGCPDITLKSMSVINCSSGKLIIVNILKADIGLFDHERDDALRYFNPFSSVRDLECSDMMKCG